MSAPIFISFASKDLSVAVTVCEALENRGFHCWLSSRDIGPGENFQVAIVRAIRLAKVMILVFSGNSNISEEVKKELVLAGQSRLVVIPLRVEDVAPDEAFAYEFATRQWIDAFHDWEHAIQRVVDQLLLVDGLKRIPDGSGPSALPHDYSEQPRHATVEKPSKSESSGSRLPNATSTSASHNWRLIALLSFGFAVLTVAILVWFGTFGRNPTGQKAEVTPRTTTSTPPDRNPTTQKADIGEIPPPPRSASPPPPAPSSSPLKSSPPLTGPAPEASPSASTLNPRVSQIGNDTQRPAPNSDLLGLWRGTSTCSQGEIGVELSLKEVRADGIVLGSLRFFNLPDRDNTAEGEYSLQGRYYHKDGMLYLQPGAWIKQPPGYSMTSFSFSFDPHGPMLTGRASNVACSTISVTKLDNGSAVPGSSR